MIIKDLKIPIRIFMNVALLNRISKQHPARGKIEQNLFKKLKGYRGEKTLKYYLGLLPDDDNRVLFDLRLQYEDYSFQIDTTIIFPNFILIIEVKNISGIITFDRESDQFLRTYQNIEESFTNPILQVQRHRILLDKLLKQNNITLPIEYLVVFSDPTTIIKTSNANPAVFKTVIHAQKLHLKFEELYAKYQQRRTSKKALDQIGNLLLQNDRPESPDILEEYQISIDDINKGVICPNCMEKGMFRNNGLWVCSSCEFRNRTAHISAILDYFLIHNSPLTNKSAQDFLLLPNRRIVSYLLSNMELPHTGSEKGRKYFCPNIDYFIDHYHFTKEERTHLKESS